MRRHSKGTIAALTGVWIVAGLLSGCSSPAKSAGMTPASLGIEKTHPYSVKIEVGGGRGTNALTDPSQISNEAFAQAIANAIGRKRLIVRKPRAIDQTSRAASG